MSCVNCTCPKCRRDDVAWLVREFGQVRTAAMLAVSQSSISRHINRRSRLASDTLSYAAALRRNLSRKG